ncbi:MAG: hypothetical protein NTX64_18790, partial [Elusimicrobia bacterium]|nr:hypothetical protein [Elusimicrobiota bacterium]
LSPRAYTGRIRFSEEEMGPAQKALGSDPRSVVVSFGSPFVFDDLHGWGAGLCAFSPYEASQRAAARGLLYPQDVKGRMPVPLKSAATTRRS